MNRRKFIGGTAAVVAATIIPAHPDGISLRSMAHPAAQPAYANVYNRIANTVGSGIRVTGNHPRALWPGVHKWFYECYKNTPTDFSKIFNE